MSKVIGAKVALWRTKMEISRGQLADALGVTVTTVALIENGVLPISPGQLQRVSDYLHVPVSEFTDNRCVSENVGIIPLFT